MCAACSCIFGGGGLRFVQALDNSVRMSLTIISAKWKCRQRQRRRRTTNSIRDVILFHCQKRGRFHYLPLSLCLTMSFATQPFIHHASVRKIIFPYCRCEHANWCESHQTIPNCSEWRINIFSGWCHANFKRKRTCVRACEMRVLSHF